MTKKLILLISILIITIICISYNSTKFNNVLFKNDWNMEFVSDIDGKILVSNPNSPNLADEIRNMKLSFNKNSTVILYDLSNDYKWKGTYTSEKLKDSIKLELKFEDEKKAITGVCGLRKYENKESIYTITFSTEKYIFSFVQSYE